MELIVLLFAVIIAIYSIVMLQLYFGFNKVTYFKTEEIEPKNGFTIIIPFRNEAKNLPKLLQSISNLDYPKNLIEIILVDDFSTDLSERICTKWRLENDEVDTTLLENLRLSNSPKKDAISRAMPIAKHEWIITTDADCELNTKWLKTIDNCIQDKNPEMIVGAVIYKTKNNWFHHFQQFDMLALQATTIASFGIEKPFMCNGANFAYTKNLFKELKGFENNNNYSSGDDVFLLQKAVKNNAKVYYLKNNDIVVKTKPENDIYSFFMQRVRWSSKSTGYDSFYAQFLALVVFFANVSISVSIILLLINKVDFKFILVVFSLKYGIDLLMINKGNTYLKQYKFILPIASSIVYPFYSSLVGIYAMLGKFSWKGRTFKK
jgi:cellulose synthase/poly-beta-1,6-N-acetylglucosamine synthase-like glycosyltransferase